MLGTSVKFTADSNIQDLKRALADSMVIFINNYLQKLAH